MNAPARLDFTDPAAVRAWLADIAGHFADVDALVRDMLAPPWKRELGPVLHAVNYAEARDAILDALACAGAIEPDGEPSDPDATPVPSGDDDDRPPWETGGAG
jgi:hypothetical protein